MGGSYSKPAAIQSRWFPEFSAALPSLAGKSFVVTGCTTGTGFVCAKTVAQKGGNVFMLNRPSERADAAAAAVKESAAKGVEVTQVACDLTSFESVKAAAAVVRGQLGDAALDVLCCNAGVMALADQATNDGYDVQLQTNHLSHFLLAKELFPLLERAVDPRIVMHSSVARKFPSSPLEARYLGKNGGNLGGNGSSMLFGGARWQRYHMSKLANAVFTHALADKLRTKGSKVKALCAAPGLSATNLQVTTSSDGGMSGAGLMMGLAQSAEDGTMPLLHCCAGKGVVSGELWEPPGIKGKPVRKELEPICTNAAACKMLWEESEKACGVWEL
jgi:NAD(P)-dependent dehydrogenase (short-subunit alcohol dehydrogenase family)